MPDRHILHSRSVSLVVNPAFEQPGGGLLRNKSSKPLARARLVRRGSVPRLAVQHPERPRLDSSGQDADEQDQFCSAADQLDHFESFGLLKHFKRDLEPIGDHDDQDDDDSEVFCAPAEPHPEVLDFLKQNQSEIMRNLAAADQPDEFQGLERKMMSLSSSSLNQMRKIGTLLRQISREFSRSRRKTF